MPDQRLDANGLGALAETMSFIEHQSTGYVGGVTARVMSATVKVGDAFAFVERDDEHGMVVVNVRWET